MVNPMRKIFSEVNRAYLAGLIDGDGAIMACIERHCEKKFNFRVRIQLKISQKEDSVLRWCKKASGFGFIRCNRSQYEWCSFNQEEIKNFLLAILPFLRVKKKQAKYALKIIQITVKTKSHLIKQAHLADTLSKLNIRSRGRRKNFATMIQENISPND